jgi:hypothetical protein
VWQGKPALNSTNPDRLMIVDWSVATSTATLNASSDHYKSPQIKLRLSEKRRDNSGQEFESIFGHGYRPEVIEAK